MFRKIKSERELIGLLRLLKLQHDIDIINQIEIPHVHPKVDPSIAYSPDKRYAMKYEKQLVRGKYAVAKLEDGVLFTINIEKLSVAMDGSNGKYVSEWRTSGKLRFDG